MEFTETGKTVYERTYARTKPDGSKETWPETVARVVDGNLSLVDPKYSSSEERDDLIRMITEFKIIPAGRHLWASGVQGRQFISNCWTSGWVEDVTEHFSFTFLRLMEGGGVGSNYSNKYLTDYPAVSGFIPMARVHEAAWYAGEPFRVHIVCDPDHADYDKLKEAGVLSEDYDHEWAGSFEVEDSREGWAAALTDFIRTYYRDAKNQNRVFDVSRVRGEGSRLKTFGGRASGPLPLAVMLHEVSEVLNNRLGEKLTGLDAMAIDHAIAKCVVSGGNRRCLPAGTRVNTDRGSVAIQDVKIGDKVVTAKGVAPVTEVFSQGIQPLVRIEHAMGVIECTPNHRVAVYKSLDDWGFKEARHLTPDDHLVWDYSGTEFGVSELPPRVSVDRTSHNARPFHVPELTPDFAWLIGYIQGNGHVHVRNGNPNYVSLSIPSENEATLNKVLRTVQQFGQPRVTDNGGWLNVFIGNSAFARWVHAYVKKTKSPMNVPEWIFTGVSDVRSAYLAGLFDADGSCKTRPVNIVSSVYPELVADVVRLGASLGMAFHVRKTTRSHDWQTLYGVDARGTENYNLLLQVFQEHSTKFRPVYRTSTGSGGNFGFTQQFAVSQGQSRYGGAKNKIIPIQELNNRGVLTGGAYPSQVRSVIPVNDPQPTYDIEVEGIHQFTADGLVVHNSARMSIMHWSDPEIFEFTKAKAEGGHWTTNISVEVDDKFWRLANTDDTGSQDAKHVLNAIVDGMLTNGEPGFWNSSLSNVGEPNPVTSTNPCLTGDTVIATLNGPKTFEELADAGQDVEVYSWHPDSKLPVIRWMRNPRKTRENTEILKVTFDSGLVVRCTPEHSFFTFRGKKVKARKLKAGQSVRAFSASRDSSGHERVHAWDSKRDAAVHQWTHRMMWENGHGPVPDGVVIAHLDHDARNNDITNLAAMTPYQHASYDYPLRFEAGFHNKAYAKNHKVVSVDAGGYADVYNGTVDDSHTYVVLDPSPVAGHMSGIISANCGEQVMEEFEACNLGHVNLAGFVNPDGSWDYEGLAYAHHLMTRFLIRATFSDITDEKSRAVVDRNRRIGVGHLGVASAIAMAGWKFSEIPNGEGDFWKILVGCKAVVDDTAVGYAHHLRIPVPVKTTTVAPTGTIAKMPGVSEGIHPIFAKYFNRRIRFSDVDPDQRAQVEQYRNLGYHTEPCQSAPQTTVVTIPTKDILLDQVTAIHGPDKAAEVVQSAADVSLVDMMRFQAVYQAHYADNAVSFTVNVDPDEYTPEEVTEAIIAIGPQLKGLTLFPEKSFPQAPYERISRSEYEFNQYLMTVADGVDESCAQGACPVR